MNKLARHLQVPNNSTLEVSVSPGAGMTCDGVFSEYSGAHVADVRWTHAQLCPGPVPPVLLKKTGKDYVADIALAFTSPAVVNVTVISIVRKPGGAIHGTPRVTPVSGQNGVGVSTVSIFVGMA